MEVERGEGEDFAGLRSALLCYDVLSCASIYCDVMCSYCRVGLHMKEWV